MQLKILEKICCPITRDKLELISLDNFIKTYNNREVEECKEGILISSSGWMYPLIDGVPRMQIDAFLTYRDFLRKRYNGYDKQKDMILKDYSKVIKSAVKNTNKTKISFGQEWAIFKYNKDRTWGWTKESRKDRFLKELNFSSEDLTGKTLLDVGCGNGVLTTAIAELGAETYGIDISPSVERAYENNTNINAHFLQADLQNPPFNLNSMDIVYSSGVIHHTHNTELSFSCISPLIKQGGRLYVWLYKPEKDFRHNFLINLRKITSKLPIKMQYILYLIFLVPQGMIKERLRGRKVNWREQLINYFDVLSPEFRHEHTPQEVEIWFRKRNFSNINVSITEYLGFGIYGDLVK